MKKGLIGIVVLAFVALICGPTLAVTFESIDVTVDATLEWIMFDETGFMPGATEEEPTLALPELTLSIGAWEASTDGEYIKYMAEMGSISLKNSADYSIFDLGGSIPGAQGIALAVELAPLSLDLVGNTDSGYGIGLGYDAGPFSVGTKYNSTGAYGVQLVYPIDLVTLTGQYANYGDRIGYLTKGEYALTAGAVSVCYQMGLDDRTITAAVDDVAEWVDHEWIVTPGSDAEMGDPFTRIIAALTDFPITDTTTFKLEVISQDLADVDYIEGLTLVGETATTLAEGVTLTLSVKSAGEALTYFGKIGISF